MVRATCNVLFESIGFLVASEIDFSYKECASELDCDCLAGTFCKTHLSNDVSLCIPLVFPKDASPAACAAILGGIGSGVEGDLRQCYLDGLAR